MKPTRIRTELWLRVIGLSELSVLKLMVRFSGKPAKQQSSVAGFFLSNRVRSDGGGSQVIYAFFCLAIAIRTGIPYHHRKFDYVEHAMVTP